MRKNELTTENERLLWEGTKMGSMNSGQNQERGYKPRSVHPIGGFQPKESKQIPVPKPSKGEKKQKN